MGREVGIRGQRGPRAVTYVDPNKDDDDSFKANEVRDTDGGEAPPLGSISIGQWCADSVPHLW